jgi:transposase InsO family protein
MGHEFRHDSQVLSRRSMEMSIRNRLVGEGPIFHSNRGVHYASQEFRNLLKGTVRKAMYESEGQLQGYTISENSLKYSSQKLAIILCMNH